MIIKRTIVVAVLAFAAAACTPNDIGLGDAAKANYAAHIVNPDPTYEGPMVGNGSQTAAAQNRYRQGTTKKPVGVKTTTGGSGSGSSGGSN